MRKINVSKKEIKSKMDKTNKDIKDLFIEIDNIFKDIKETDILSGKVCRSIYDRYILLHAYFPKINYELEKIKNELDEERDI